MQCQGRQSLSQSPPGGCLTPYPPPLQRETHHTVPLQSSLTSSGTHDLKAGSNDPHPTHAARWKLSRGKWRPSLLGYAKAHSESTVASSSTAALRALGPSPAPLERVTAALNHLTTLKGVGVATASAVLAAVDPSVPFMSDEAIAAALPGDKRYTLSVYVHVLKWLRARAAALQQHAADDGVVWRVREVERALWTEAALTRGGPATQKQKAAPGGSAPPARRSSAKRRKM